jgi:hypothetical protein
MNIGRCRVSNHWFCRGADRHSAQIADFAQYRLPSPHRQQTVGTSSIGQRHLGALIASDDCWIKPNDRIRNAGPLVMMEIRAKASAWHASTQSPSPGHDRCRSLDTANFDSLSRYDRN